MICCTVSSPEKPYFSLMMKAPNAIRTSLATGSYQQHAVDGHLGNKGDRFSSYEFIQTVRESSKKLRQFNL
ncbi:hypothetical protein [Desulfosporosinus metallidurans]|uniref:Uncharacterized protein n=1 Tax=Desulfosporosinus metallidurans TaxID=1888891 RepID=A0A1Q8QXS9_9FIRM|nr:hypothetical protein [Desulfosporosinus metallidurans]OLN32143.1 hypothetical protein DSOL_2016 [Desulfosporosinus metallidurans]